VLVARRIPGARDRLVLGLTLGADRYRSRSQGRCREAARSRAALERWCAAIGLVPQFTCADGLVILWQKGNAEAGLDLMRRLTGQLKLMVHEDKPPICTVPERSFDFLGHTFGRMYSAKIGRGRLSYGRRRSASNGP
jgi:hypothetical protein